jgi:hypothetical protein
VTLLDPHDTQHVQAFWAPVETVVFGGDHDEVPARKLRGRSHPRLKVLSLPEAKRRERRRQNLRHHLRVTICLEQRHGHDIPCWLGFYRVVATLDALPERIAPR